MSDKTFHYRTEPGQIAGVVDVSEKQLAAGPDAMMVFDMNDVKALYRYMKVPVSKFRPPEVKLDDNDVDTIVLKHGNVEIYISREQWGEFVNAVVDLKLPHTTVPEEVEIEVEIQVNHTFTVETATLLEDHERITKDGDWAGSQDSLNDAVADAAHDWDWFSELGGLTFRDLDYVDKTDTHTN